MHDHEQEKVLPHNHDGFDSPRVRGLDLEGSPIFKVWTTVPAYTGKQGEQVLYTSGGNYRLYTFLDGAWRATGIAAGQLLGTATNDNANAGNVGEYITGQVTSGSSISLTTATPKTIKSISLTAGDWDVRGVVDFTLAATTTLNYLKGGTSSTADTLGGQDTYATLSFSGSPTFSGLPDMSIVCPITRYSLASTTTIYLIAAASFAVAGCNGYGTIIARRIR